MDNKSIQQLAEQTLIKHGRADSEKRVAKGEIISYEPIQIEELREMEHFNFHVAYGVEMFEAGAAAASPLLRWVKASEREPSIGDYYYCKVDLKKDGILQTIVEWGIHKNGSYEYYDWDLKNIQHFGDVGEEAQVVEWLEEAPAPQAIPEKEEIKMNDVLSKEGFDKINQKAKAYADNWVDNEKDPVEWSRTKTLYVKAAIWGYTLAARGEGSASLRGKEEGERGASPNKEEDDFHEGMWNWGDRGR
jgi:hypothetical protein